MLHREIVDGHVVVIHAEPRKDKLRIEVVIDDDSAVWEKIDRDQLDDNPAKTALVNKGFFTVWERFLQSKSDSPASILAHVSKVILYDHQFSADIYFDDNVYRLDKDGFISSKSFVIWYLGTFHRIPLIKEEEWKEFVAEILAMAEVSFYDPLGVDMMGMLLDMMRQSEIHSDFCDRTAEIYSPGGARAWFVYIKENDFALYVPSGVVQSIRHRADMKSKAFKNYWVPFLMDNRYVHALGTAGVYEKRPSSKFWVLSVEKIAEVDASIAELLANTIDCQKECAIEVKQ
jgi:hypothetical protein